MTLVELPPCGTCGDDAPVVVDGVPLCSACALSYERGTA